MLSPMANPVMPLSTLDLAATPFLADLATNLFPMADLATVLLTAMAMVLILSLYSSPPSLITS